MTLGVVSLVNRHLKSVESVRPALNRRLILNTFKLSAVPRPERSCRPLAKLLYLASVITRRHSRIEATGLNPILNPINDRSHVILRVRARLELVGTAMRRARYKVELVPVSHGFLGFGIGHAGVHD